MAEHHYYDALRETQRQVEDTKEREALEAERARNPYTALLDTHRQVAEAEAKKPIERTEAEWIELASERDAAYIQRLRDRDVESEAEIGYRDKALETEPLAKKLQRTKYEVGQEEELERNREYLADLRAKVGPPQHDKADAPHRPHSNEDLLRIAQLSAHIARVEATQKEREPTLVRENDGLSR